MLRIGFDAKRLFNNHTGLGNYSRTLVRNLASFYPEATYHLYSPKAQQNQETQHFFEHPYYKIHTSNQKPSAYWRSFSIKKDLKAHEIQLYHGLSHEIPFGIHQTGIKSIVTIHDLVFKYYPAQYTFIDRSIYDYKFRYACMRADKVIAISEQTKSDIITYYGIEAEKIEVIYQTCDKRYLLQWEEKALAEIRQKYNLPKEYILSVGSIIERKNLLGVVRALRQLPSDLSLPLVVVGKGMAYKKKVQEFLTEKKMEQRVLFVDIDNEDLPAVYQMAALFIYPSFYEGFGIPVLESIFSKTPVITSDRSSLPEAGGPHSYLVDPGSDEQIAHAIKDVLVNEDLRTKMIQKSFEYAQQFMGGKLSTQLLNLYQKVIA